MAPLHEVCVVYSGVGCGLRSFGPYHPLPPTPHPPPAAGPPPHQLSGQGGRVDGVNEQAGDRARVGPPPYHHPFIPTTHPATMQDHPHLPCQHRMGVYTTTPFTHPHHHASHLSHSPRWRCHRSVGTTPHYLARLTRASTSTNPCRPYPSPRPLPPPSTGARWRRGHQPTVRAGDIGAGASESIGASGGARRGPAARPFVVWGCAVPVV